MFAMTNAEMADHTTRILRTATADGTMATDAMTATAQALAVLVVATAEREGVAFDDILKEILHSVTSFAIDIDARSQAS